MIGFIVERKKAVAKRCNQTHAWASDRHCTTGITEVVEMNKREMSAAISADYEAWLAGVKHRSALFDEPVKSKASYSSDQKPTATIHKVAKTIESKKAESIQRPPPDEPIIDAIRACLIKPLLKTEVVDIVSKRLGVNRRSVFNSIKTGFVFKASKDARTNRHTNVCW